MWRYKARELAHYWVDYIKSYIKIPDKNILYSLSANSNFKLFDYWINKLIIELLPLAVDKYKRFYQIRFNSISIAFIWSDWVEKGNNIANDFIEVTGQALNIFWLDIFYFLMENFDLWFVKYKRIDFCFDIFMKMDYFYNSILWEKHKKSVTAINQSKKNWVETIYFWQKMLKKNNYMLTRIYNKIVDTVKKEKLFLYNERNDEKGNIRDVTRFEIEAREDLAKYYKFNDLKNDNIVFARLVKSFYKLNVQFFKFLDFSAFKKYADKERKEKKQILYRIKNWDEIKTISVHQDRIKKKLQEQKDFLKYGKTILNESELKSSLTMFISYAKKLYKAGYSVEKLAEIIKINTD